MIGALLGWGVWGVFRLQFSMTSNTPIRSRGTCREGGGESLRGRAPSQETSCRRWLRRLSHTKGCSQPVWAYVAHGGELAAMLVAVDSIPWSAP